MDEKRIKQILSSPADIDVEYHGVSVWIDQLNEDEKTATVHIRGSSDEKSIVNIHALEEKA